MTEREETRALIEKVLGVKYCLAYVYRRYVEHKELNKCKQLYCCKTCPIRCPNPTCIPFESGKFCPEHYETLMLAIRRYKWIKKRKNPMYSGYIWYSELVKHAR